LKLLHSEGIYVLLELFTNIQLKDDSHRIQASDIDTQRLYSSLKVRKNLAIVGQTSHFPNILGYSISQSLIWGRAATKLAALHRAAVRDVKLFLLKTGARKIPVGANMSANQQFRREALQFMTAGEPEERVDFMSFGVYDWGSPSNFQMSGYKGLCEAFESWPVPMFFAEYGTAFSGRKRVLDEVECLFSRDMTGVFSGGFLHTYGHMEVRREAKGVVETPLEINDGEKNDAAKDENDTDDDDDDDDDSDDSDLDSEEGGYELVSVEDNGSRKPKRAFTRYQQRLADVDSKPLAAIVGDHEMKDYESWRGQFTATPRFWEGDVRDVPLFPLEWNQVVE
jgi:predicted GNAT family N-acyltransferase